MTTRTFLIFAIVSSAIIACTSSKPSTYLVTDISESLVLSLDIDKDTFQIDEPLNAVLRITNAGNFNVLIKKRMATNTWSESTARRDVVFIVTSPSGRTASYKPRSHNYSVEDSDFVVLSTGEKIEQIYNLSVLYYIDEYGTYSVFAIYQNSSDPSDGVAWRGELVSNVVLFTIISSHPTP